MSDSFQMQILREVYHNLSNPSTPNEGRTETTTLVATRQDGATSREGSAGKLGQSTSSEDSWKQHLKADQSSLATSAADDETSRAARALEQDFAIAVFEIGLRQSSPKVLKGLMLPSESGSLTTEHIKSHLQKYRLHYERSKEEFLGHYRKYLRLDRGEGSIRVGQKHDAVDDQLAPGTAPSSTLRDDSTDGDGMRSCGARLSHRSEREIAQLVRVQNVHNQLVHEQLELQNTLQSQMHEQLHLQAELNALMREAASIPMFGPDADNESSNART